METVIWLVAIGLPIAALLFLFGWMVGFNEGSDMGNWGTGFDDGWKAYKEFVIETGRADNGLDKPGNAGK